MLILSSYVYDFAMSLGSEGAIHEALFLTYLSAGFQFAHHLFSNNLNSVDPNLLSKLTPFFSGLVFLLVALFWPVFFVTILFMGVVGKIGQFVVSK